MNDFEFMQKSSSLQQICGKIYALENEPLLKSDIQKLKNTLKVKDEDTSLKIAVCGQYSSGKSTLVKTLTHDTDIRIGQDVTTDSVKIYPWNGVMIADTPGIYAGRTEHDTLSLDFIQKADLLVYMITIQGFTREIGDNFKKLIIGQYFDKTMLLMNKRNQEPAENEKLWRRDTADFVGGEDNLRKLHFSIVDIEDYLTGTQENVQELVEESHFNDFIGNLNLFIKEKALTGKILSRINIVQAFLAIYISSFSQQQREDEFTRRQLKIVETAISKYKQVTANSILRTRQKVKQLKYHLLGLLTDKTLKQFHDEVDSVDLKLQAIFNDEQLQNELVAIATELEEAMDAVTQEAMTYENRLNELADKFNKISVGNTIDLSSFRSGAEGLAKLVGGVTKDGVLQVAHFFGHSFKPWGATKLTNAIKGLGPWLAGLGVVIDVVSFGLDKKHQAEMANARTKLASGFDEVDAAIPEQFATMEGMEGSFFSRLNKLKETLSERKKRQEEVAVRKHELAEQLSSLNLEFDTLKAEL